VQQENTLTLVIDGMHCGGCVTRVTNTLSKLKGVAVDNVEVGSARVRYQAAETDEAAIVHAIERIGFQARAAD